MRIGIDARLFRSEVAGIGRYSQNLIKNLLKIDKKNQYILFMTAADKKEFKNYLIKNLLKIENLKLKIVIADIPHYSLAEQIKFPKIIARENLDLMHFLNFNYPIRYKGKFIVTIHDLTLLIYPETAKETNFLKQAAYKYTMKRACQNAAKIIAVSENTKKDIVEKFQISKDKIQTIYEAADDKIVRISNCKLQISNLRSRYKKSGPVILTVGQFRPHKNLPRLVEAFKLVRRHLPVKLVILGKPDPKHKFLYSAIDKSNLSKDIIMPGYVSDNDLAAWYQAATVFVIPSLYEGFGLPGLEAMRAGLPVVSSNRSALPEIYGQAAIYFDPFNPSDIADKIKLVLQDNNLRSKLIHLSKTQAQKYSWGKTAEETLDLYEEIQT